jgi:hypothetical protein
MNELLEASPFWMGLVAGGGSTRPLGNRLARLGKKKHCFIGGQRAVSLAPIPYPSPRRNIYSVTLFVPVLEWRASNSHERIRRILRF